METTKLAKYLQEDGKSKKQLNEEETTTQETSRFLKYLVKANVCKPELKNKHFIRTWNDKELFPNKLTKIEKNVLRYL
jgi:orotate phosphoribosyltransferase-like protein